MPEPLKIAGAGLSGMVASLALALGGRRVEVYERKTRLLPSSGPHTEGIRNYRSLDVLDELRSFDFDLTPFSTVGRTFRHSPKFSNLVLGPAHYLFLRGREADTVDQSLFRRAQEAGVRFHFGQSIEPKEADVVATGPPADRFNVLGAGYTFSAEGSSLRPDIAHALFDNDVAPSGYLVITPGRMFHSIYSVSWSELRFDRLLARTEAAFKIPWIKEILGSSRFVEKIHGRAYFREDPISPAVQGGSLLVGEAGGFQDAVAGFGFRYAVITGALAARSILEGSDYQELLRAHFGSEFRDAFAFRRHLNHATNEDYDAMIASLGSEIKLEEYVKRREARGF